MIDFNNDKIVFVYFGHTGSGNVLMRLLSMSEECADLELSNHYNSLFSFNEDANTYIFEEGGYFCNFRRADAKNAHTKKTWLKTTRGKFPFDLFKPYYKSDDLDYKIKLLRRYLRKIHTPNMIQAQNDKKIMLHPSHAPIGSLVYPNSKFVTVTNSQPFEVFARNYSEKRDDSFSHYTRTQFKQNMIDRIKNSLVQHPVLTDDGIDVINTDRNIFADIHKILNNDYDEYLKVCKFLKITPVSEFTMCRYINEYLRVQFVRPPRKSTW